jgi:hypothetical protein
MGPQQEAQRAALIDSIRRADRASLLPASATLEGLSASGTSGVSSVSTVGITQSLLPDRDINFRRGSKARLSLWLVAIALVVGGIAFAVARNPSDRTEAAPGPARAGNEERRRAAGAPRRPRADPTADRSNQVEDDAGHARRPLTGDARVASPAPGSASPAVEKSSWREDPGF